MAKIDALRPKAAIAPPLNVGFRNSFRSNMGWERNSSATVNAMSSSAASAKQPSTRLLLNDFSFDSISPYTRLDRATVNSTKPIQSGRLASGERDSDTLSVVMMTAAAPDGRVTKE